MNPLPKRIALLLATGSFVIGLFLLASNLRLVSDGAMNVVINLWPLLLMFGGIMLVIDSNRKRLTTDEAAPTTRQFPLPIEPGSSELACRLMFSYGTLVVTPGDSRLVTEHVGNGPDPSISRQLLGQRSEITVATGQPLFPAHFQLHNRWSLELPPRIALRLSLQLHESDLRMDLRQLDVESLELRAESGTQEIFIGRPGRKMTAQVYSSGGSLSLFLPAHVFSWVRLLNPFCRVDYPQGDLEKREDGSLVTPRTQNSRESVEIEVDGPIRNLVLDIMEAPET